jgi:hypothetical protein
MQKKNQSRTRHASAIDVFVINVTSPTAGFILCSSQIVASLFGEQAPWSKSDAKTPRTPKALPATAGRQWEMR